MCELVTFININLLLGSLNIYFYMYSRAVTGRHLLIGKPRLLVDIISNPELINTVFICTLISCWFA